MFDASIRKIFILIFLFVMIVCSKVDVFKKIRDGNFDIVAKGTYRGHAIFLRQAGEYEHLVNDLRSEIEKNRDVLPMITRKFFFVPQELFYRFKLIMLDNKKNYLLLRYFARVTDHPIYAGYQIQFVFDLESKNLIAIYTAEVPLE